MKPIDLMKFSSACVIFSLICALISGKSWLLILSFVCALINVVCWMVVLSNVRKKESYERILKHIDKLSDDQEAKS